MKELGGHGSLSEGRFCVAEWPESKPQGVGTGAARQVIPSGPLTVLAKSEALPRRAGSHFPPSEKVLSSRKVYLLSGCCTSKLCRIYHQPHPDLEVL